MIWRKLYRVRVAIMTHFCTLGTVTPVLIIGFGWLFLIDRSRCQAFLMQVSSTLRTRVKCENIFCVMVANHDPQWHTFLPQWRTFKKHWKQWGHDNTTDKKFSHKKVLYFWQKCDFYSFISTIHNDRL